MCQFRIYPWLYVCHLVTYSSAYNNWYRFLEYLTSGWEIELICAIDFTASNGNPQRPNSLHFYDPNLPNEYIRAIRAVGDIVACYDKDRVFPVYGFGARFPDGRVYHDFHVNLKKETVRFGDFGTGVQNLTFRSLKYMASMESFQPINGPWDT